MITANALEKGKRTALIHSDQIGQSAWLQSSIFPSVSVAINCSTLHCLTVPEYLQVGLSLVYTVQFISIPPPDKHPTLPLFCLCVMFI